MPEGPNVFLMGELVNSLDDKGVRYTNVQAVSNWSRSGIDDVLLASLPPPPWRITAITRGKELILVIATDGCADASSSSAVAAPASAASSSSDVAAPATDDQSCAEASKDDEEKATSAASSSKDDEEKATNEETEAAYMALTVAQLKQLAEQMKVAVASRVAKAELVRRLLASPELAAHGPAFRASVQGKASSKPEATRQKRQRGEQSKDDNDEQAEQDSKGKTKKERRASGDVAAGYPAERPSSMKVLVSMGLTGNLYWAAAGAAQPKSAHIGFFAEQGTLYYLDPRRLGDFTWHVRDWADDRGPDPCQEYEAFARNVCDQFDKLKKRSVPIVDVLLEQNLFNGVGNYLRVEILDRVNVGPLAPVGRALLACEPNGGETITPDNRLLQAVRDVWTACVGVLKQERENSAVAESYEGGELFRAWLQVYDKAGGDVKTTKHKGRSIWWRGSDTRLPTA